MVQGRNPGWIRPLNEVADPAARVVCLPHSGGSAGSYRAWTSAMPADVQLFAVQYPGGGDRAAATPPAGVAGMSGHIAEELLRLGPRALAGYALFGHRVGALIAYETALTMRDRGFPPTCLYVSGSAAPGGPRGDRASHEAGDRELWSSICALGGIDPAIAGNRELCELLLPALRAGVGGARSYRPSPRAHPLPCPVRCYYSPGDPLSSEADMAAWSATTTGPFSTRERPGGHFHLWTDTDGLVRDILSVLPRRAAPAVISPPPELRTGGGKRVPLPA
jgi:surfactin synthase thioesterase subunit